MIPVEVNQVVELEIQDLTHEGQGIGKVEQFPIFVERALPGELVTVRIDQIKKSFALAKLLKINKRSEDRVVPKCTIYEQCGGCNLQHLGYHSQLRQKTKLVYETIKRIGKVEVDVKDCIGMDEPWRYRNKTQVPFGMKDGKVVSGFFQQGTHDIIDMAGCDIENEITDRIIERIKTSLSQLTITPYEEANHQGILRHVIVRNGYVTNHYMVTLVVTSFDVPNLNKLISILSEEFSVIKSIVLNLNDKRTNTILGNESKVVFGEAYIYDYIGDVKFAISSKSFYQVNPIQTKKLYDIVKGYAKLTGDEIIVDAYCGIGTIGLYLSKSAKAIYGVEIVKEAIDDAKLNAKINGFTNAHYEVGKAEDVIIKWKRQGVNPDVIVIDPPRKGCDQKLLDTIVEMKTPRVVYVSCNPSTLARDLNILKDYYTIEDIQPVDMFPHTTHVETVVLMSRK